MWSGNGYTCLLRFSFQMSNGGSDIFGMMTVGMVILIYIIVRECVLVGVWESLYVIATVCLLCGQWVLIPGGHNHTWFSPLKSWTGNMQFVVNHADTKWTFFFVSLNEKRWSVTRRREHHEGHKKKQNKNITLWTIRAMHKIEGNISSWQNQKLS